MSTFSTEWLALREPADHSARPLSVTRAVADRFPRDRRLNVLDLGAGTGSNLRYLAEHLPADQRWVLVDHDAQLLARVPSELRGPQFACQVTTRRVGLEASVDDDELYVGRQLVTASALLDLASEVWLETLATQSARHRATVLFALSYDGRIVCTPSEPEDQTIRELVNRHQRTDKGFGPAAGPDAIEMVRERFVSLGYEVVCEPSDWRLTTEMRDLQRELMRGWASAALDIAPDRAPMIERWLSRRLTHLDERRSELTVGHMDVAGWPGRA